jgi:type I restriction enzyme M protein
MQTKTLRKVKKAKFLRQRILRKSDYVLQNKVEEPTQVSWFKTIEENEFTLNIKKYVDNTPEPAPEDVKAHLSGWYSITEIEAVETSICLKFNYDGSALFKIKTKYIRTS